MTIKEHNDRELMHYVIAKGQLEASVHMGYGSPTQTLPIPKLILPYQENEKVEDA